MKWNSKAESSALQKCREQGAFPGHNEGRSCHRCSTELTNFRSSDCQMPKGSVLIWGN